MLVLGLPLYSHYITPISLGSPHINPHKLQGSLLGVPPKVLRDVGFGFACRV